MTAKLSLNQQAAMWSRAYVRPDHMPWSLRTLARAPRTATYDALRRHGLIEQAGREFTDAGHVWIAEQIDTAHVEALWANLDRAQHLSPREATGTAVTDRAERMLLRAGEQVGIMLDFDLAEDDRIDALNEHARRAYERWDAVADLRVSVCTPVAYELSAALALAARWGVVDCPPEIVLRAETEAWELYSAALDYQHAGLIERGDLALNIARGTGYAGDVLRKIAATYATAA